LDGSGPDRRRPTIRRATPQDAADLAAFGRQAFTDTFGRDNTPEDLALYLAAAYGPEIQRAELVNPAVSCWLAESGSDIAGYSSGAGRRPRRSTVTPQSRSAAFM
jgi:hypothetical protein